MVTLSLVQSHTTVSMIGILVYMSTLVHFGVPGGLQGLKKSTYDTVSFDIYCCFTSFILSKRLALQHIQYYVLSFY